MKNKLWCDLEVKSLGLKLRKPGLWFDVFVTANGIASVSANIGQEYITLTTIEVLLRKIFDIDSKRTRKVINVFDVGGVFNLDIALLEQRLQVD